MQGFKPNLCFLTKRYNDLVIHEDHVKMLTFAKRVLKKEKEKSVQLVYKNIQTNPEATAGNLNEQFLIHTIMSSLLMSTINVKINVVILHLCECVLREAGATTVKTFTHKKKCHQQNILELHPFAQLQISTFMTSRTLWFNLK